MSKITVAGVRTNVQSLLEYSNNEKKRNFLETVELQVRSTHILGPFIS
jgi:large subunit ribosomal protein L10Ae